MRDAVLAHCVCLSCLAASECECKSDVEDVEQSEANTLGKNHIAENLHVSAQPTCSTVHVSAQPTRSTVHVSAQPTHSTVHVMHLAWLSVEGSASGPARCVCVCVCMRTCACACACVCMHVPSEASLKYTVCLYMHTYVPFLAECCQ